MGTELDVVHRDGSITLHGSALFTGSVNGRSGTLLFTYTGIGNAVTGHETLHFVGRQGTGDLAGLHANLTAEGDVGAPLQDAMPPERGLIPDGFFCSVSDSVKQRSLQSAVTLHRVTALLFWQAAAKTNLRSTRYLQTVS